jgi:hypothetical protein
VVSQQEKKAKFDDGSLDDDKEELKAKKDSESKAKDDNENNQRK